MPSALASLRSNTFRWFLDTTDIAAVEIVQGCSGKLSLLLRWCLKNLNDNHRVSCLLTVLTLQFQTGLKDDFFKKVQWLSCTTAGLCLAKFFFYNFSDHFSHMRLVIAITLIHMDWSLLLHKEFTTCSSIKTTIIFVNTPVYQVDSMTNSWSVCTADFLPLDD